MKILKEQNLEWPVLVGPRDSLSIDYNGEHVCTVPVGNPMLIDRVVICEIQDEFGFKTGLAAFMGESKE
jgi:hypothetical protein